jgi:hypothetical protein
MGNQSASVYCVGHLARDGQRQGSQVEEHNQTELWGLGYLCLEPEGPCAMHLLISCLHSAGFTMPVQRVLLTSCMAYLVGLHSMMAADIGNPGIIWAVQFYSLLSLVLLIEGPSRSLLAMPCCEWHAMGVPFFVKETLQLYVLQWCQTALLQWKFDLPFNSD